MAAYRRAIALDPDFADPYRNLAACRELTTADAEIARIAALAERADLPAEERVAAGFALGKALDDSERYDEAFAAYDRANRLYRAARAEAGDRFDAAELSRAVDRSIAEFTAEFFAGIRGWGNPSEVPVFIVGLPRSGTSLVEQIAASHSRVFGAGELRSIGETAAALGPPTGGRTRRCAAPPTVTSSACARWAAEPSGSSTRCPTTFSCSGSSPRFTRRRGSSSAGGTRAISACPAISRNSPPAC